MIDKVIKILQVESPVKVDFKEDHDNATTISYLLNSLDENNHYPNKSAEDIIKIKENLQTFCEKHGLEVDYAGLNKLIRNTSEMTRSYHKLYFKVKNTIDFVKNSSLQAHLFSKIASEYDDWNQDVYTILKCLSNLGFHSFIQELSLNDETGKRSELQFFLNKLYAIFQILSEKGENEISTASLKKLKKHIHHFAELNGFDKKIFNLQKLGFNDEKRRYEYIAALTNETTAEKRKHRAMKRRLSFVYWVMSIFNQIFGKKSQAQNSQIGLTDFFKQRIGSDCYGMKMDTMVKTILSPS